MASWGDDLISAVTWGSLRTRNNHKATVSSFGFLAEWLKWHAWTLGKHSDRGRLPHSAILQSSRNIYQVPSSHYKTSHSHAPLDPSWHSRDATHTRARSVITLNKQLILKKNKINKIAWTKKKKTMVLFSSGCIFPTDPVFTMWLTENSGTPCYVSFTYVLLQCVRSCILTQGTRFDSSYIVYHTCYLMKI